MNNSMTASATYRSRGAFDHRLTRPPAEEPPARSSPPAYSALAAVWDLRCERAARQVAHAERYLRRLRHEQLQAEAQWSRSTECANELERDWHRIYKDRETSCRNIELARAVQSRYDILVRGHAQALCDATRDQASASEALAQARQAYGTATSKVEKIRILRQRFDALYLA